MVTKEEKAAIVAEYGKDASDTGSPRVQLALITARVRDLTEHLKANFKDHSTRRGLLAMVALRKKLLSYLARENRAKYLEITETLGIRRAK